MSLVGKFCHHTPIESEFCFIPTLKAEAVLPNLISGVFHPFVKEFDFGSPVNMALSDGSPALTPFTNKTSYIWTITT